MAQVEQLPASRVRATLAVALLLVIASIWELVPVLRQKLAERYDNRGQSYLLLLEFGEAKTQYQKALYYNPQDAAAKEGLRLAEAGPVDIAADRDFYAAHGVRTVLDLLDKAQAAYTTPKAALQAGVDLYSNREFSYAQYALLRAVSLDPGYTDAWHYLALDYQELAKLDGSYQGKATEAVKRQNGLSTKYLGQ